MQGVDEKIPWPKPQPLAQQLQSSVLPTQRQLPEEPSRSSRCEGVGAWTPQTRRGARASRHAPAWPLRPCGWPRPPRVPSPAPPPIQARLACGRHPYRTGCRRRGGRVLGASRHKGGGNVAAGDKEANKASRSRRGGWANGVVGWGWWCPLCRPAPRLDVGQPLNRPSTPPPLYHPGPERRQQQYPHGAPARARGGGGVRRAPIQAPPAVVRAGDGSCKHLNVPCEKTLLAPGGGVGGAARARGVGGGKRRAKRRAGRSRHGQPIKGRVAGDGGAPSALSHRRKRREQSDARTCQRVAQTVWPAWPPLALVVSPRLRDNEAHAPPCVG